MDIPESDDIDLSGHPLPPPFDTAFCPWGQDPIDAVPHLPEPPSDPHIPELRRVILIGFEGLNWDVLNHLIRSHATPRLEALVARGLRARLKTGLSEYATPEAAWARVLTGKAHPTPENPFIWNRMPEKRMALLDLPQASPGDTSDELFFSVKAQGMDYADSLPMEEGVPASFDFAATKFRILRDHDFDWAIVSINQPDKTQHRALLGYRMEAMLDKSRFFLHPPFGPIFEKNRQELEEVYNHLDVLAGYLTATFPNDRLVCFSVHGHQPVSYEIRIQYDPALPTGLALEGSVNSTVPQPIRMTVNGQTLTGSQRTIARLLPVITTPETGATAYCCLSYLQWEFAAPNGRANPASRFFIKKAVEKHLASIRFGDKPFFAVGYTDEHLIARPTDAALARMAGDPSGPFQYAGGIVVTRVQSGHPREADGVFLVSGPGIPSNRVIGDLELKDVLSFCPGSGFSR